jgi:molybdate transport system ATP-binding protein
MSIDLDIRKHFSGFDLSVRFSVGNERLGLLGASGCGKSMTLKCIAGIETPDWGRIVINGTTVFDSEKKINVPPQKRHTGYLFQKYALFHNMTVRENLAIALRHIPASEKKKKIDEMLSKLKIAELATRKPSQLSGGQQQRVAIARMLVLSPLVVMLDEPFSALDSFLRSTVEKELMDILSGFDGTTLFVSHDRDEVFRICQHMVILDHGRIMCSGTRDDIFRNPQTVSAARLTGCKNIAPAFRISTRSLYVDEWGLTLITAEDIPHTVTHVGLRAHHIRPPKIGETENCFDFTVSRYESAPFTLTEYITAIPGESEQEASPHKQNCPLVRKISNQEGVSYHDGMEHPQHLRLCLPAEYLLLLEEESSYSTLVLQHHVKN